MYSFLSNIFFKLKPSYSYQFLKVISLSILLAIFHYLFLYLFFNIKPNSISKFNIVLQNDYKGQIDENQYLDKINQIYAIKEYDIDYNVSNKVIKEIYDLFDFHIKIRNFFNGKINDDLLKEFCKINYQKMTQYYIKQEDLEIISKVDIDQMIFFRKLIIEKIELYYKQGILEEDLIKVLTELNVFLGEYIKNFKNRKYLDKYKIILTEFLSVVLVPNKFINISKTLEKHSEMISKIPRIYSLSKGSIIVKKGQLVNEEAYKIIIETKTKQYYNKKLLLDSFVVFLLFLFMTFSLVLQGVKDRDLVIICILLLFISFPMILLDKPFYYLIPFWSLILFSFFVGGVILSVLATFWLIIYNNMVYYQLFSSMYNFDYILFIIFSYLFLFYFLVKNDKNRISIFLNEFGFWIFNLWIIYLLLYLIVFFVFMSLLGFVEKFFVYFSFSLVSVVISFVLVYFLVLMLGIGIEDIGLWKIRWLLDLNNPVLSELSKSAPGTFNHSLRVSELSEACARAINVNPILVKIGALYHDIGKMLRPKYFVENLVQGEENPHDQKEPYMSASIIKSHVTDGIKLAQKYNLPKVVYDFITTHHGTTTILYFFVKAKNLQNTNKKYSFVIREEDFKYPGPKPYNKEMLILMICDSVEAASRSLQEYSYSAIEKLTENIINRLIKEDQFSDVDITFKELQKIKETLIKNLYISYHTRIKYPSK